MGQVYDIKQVGVEIELDKKRHLLFDLDSFCEIEEKYGSIGKMFEAIGKRSMKDLRYMAWVGLKNEDDKLTEEGAGKLIIVTKLGELSTKLMLAAGLSLPEEDKSKLKNEETKGMKATTVKKDSLGQD